MGALYYTIFNNQSCKTLQSLQAARILITYEGGKVLDGDGDDLTGIVRGGWFTPLIVMSVCMILPDSKASVGADWLWSMEDCLL